MLFLYIKKILLVYNFDLTILQVDLIYYNKNLSCLTHLNRLVLEFRTSEHSQVGL